MKFSMVCASLLAVLVWSGSASAALLGLNNTGGAGWSFGSTPVGAGPLTVVTTPNGLWGNQASTSWLSDVADTAGSSSPAGNYEFLTSFDLTGATVFGLNLSFDVLYDNFISIDIVNSLGTANLYTSVLPNFQLPAATVSVNPMFVDTNGVNTLRFTVTNAVAGGTNPVGLNVLFTEQSYSGEPPPIPEPMSVALWGGLLGIGAIARRRFKK